MTRQLVPHLGWMDYPDGDEVAQYLAEGWFEYAEQAFCWLYLRPGDAVIDCGAHAGLYSRLAALAVGESGRVIAVEPTGEMADLVERNTPEGGRVEVIRAAVGASAGVARLAPVAAGRTAYASVVPAGEDGTDPAGAGGYSEVRRTTVDEIAGDAGLDRVAFLKLDIEGGERDALRGAVGLLEARRVDVLMVEFDEKILASIGSSTAELIAQLERAGLELFRFCPRARTIVPLERDGPLWYDNVLAVPDAGAVRDRLDSATESRRVIASDVLARGSLASELRRAADTAARLEHTESEGRTYIERLEGNLSEANTDRQELREAMNALADQRNAIGVELAEERARLGARCEAAEQRASSVSAELNELASVHAELTTAYEQLVGDALALKRHLDITTEQRDRARSALDLTADAADRFCSTLLRVCRLPLARPVMRAITPDRAPWLKDLNGELGRVRRAAALPAADAEDDQSPIEPGADGPLLSVIICTHNPRRDLLDWTLDSIRTQTLDRACFELIVVDNNSSPGLDAAELDPGGSLGLRVVRESRPGLTFARIGGLEASRAGVLVYVDDDNALAPDYLEQAVRIARREPEIGSFGGIAESVLEAEPPEWIRELIPHLGVRDHGGEVITSKNEHWGEWDPIGAGMVVRRSVAERYAEVVQSTSTAGGLGRQGNAQLSGEDTLMNRCANLEGFACSYQPSLRLRHFMKADRLTGKNIRKTIEGHGRSYVVLERVLGREVEPITGLKRWRWLAQRALLRAPNGLSKGYALWRWDVGYARASAERVSASTVGSTG